MVSQEAHVRRRLSSRIRSGKLKISAPISNDDDGDIHDPEQPPVPPLPPPPSSPGAATVLTTGTRTPVSPLRQNPTRSRVVSHGSDFENLVGVRHDSLSRSQSMEWERQLRRDASTTGRRTRPASQAYLQTPRQQSARDSSHGLTPPSSHNSPATTDTAKKKHGRSSLRFALRKMLGIKQKGDEPRFMPPTRQGLPQKTGEPATMPTTPGYDEGTAVDPSRLHAEQVADMGAGVKQLPLSHHGTPFSVNNRSQKELERPPFSPSTPSTSTYQKRRATLPSIIRASSEAANLAALWELQYSRQNASGDEQIPKMPVHESDIGVAVTSGAANNINSVVGSMNAGFSNGINATIPKRRSRSAGALHDLVRSQSGMPVRKRSDEIRYWRQSLLPPAVTSFSTRSIKFNDGIDDSLIASPDTVPLAGPTYTGRANISDDAFDFQRSKNVEPLGTEKGYDDVGRPSASLKKRMERLEAGVAAMERSMRQLKGRSHRQTVIMQEDSGPRKRRGRQSRWLPTGEYEELEGEDRSSSSDSSLTPPRLRSPFLPSVAGAKHWRRQHHSHSPSYRTSSNSQHHPYISAYTYGLSGDPPGSTQHRADPTAAVIADAAAAAAHEQVRALYLLLSQERSKRKALEVHVSALQRNISDVRDIATAAMASAAKPHLYEMPVAPFSPNSQLPALTSQALAGEPAALMGADPRRQTQVSRFSHFDSDDDIDGSARTGQAGVVMSAGDYDESEGASNTNRSSNANNDTRERRRQSGRKSRRSSKNDENNYDDKNENLEEEEGEATVIAAAGSEIATTSTRPRQPVEGLQQRRNRSELLNVDSVTSESLAACPVAAAAAAVATAAGIGPSTTRSGEGGPGAEGGEDGEGCRIGENGGLLSSPSLNSPYTEDDFQTPDEELAPFSANFGNEGGGGQGLAVAGCN